MNKRRWVVIIHAIFCNLLTPKYLQSFYDLLYLKPNRKTKKNVFNHWFAQGAIPGSITRGVITLLKKGSRHFWEDLDDYRPITLLNTELKILARVLANCLQLVISGLIGPEQNYAVKGRSIQDNLDLAREILEGIEDEAALINLDRSKAFDRVDHQFMAAILETARFDPEFRKWISILYHNPQVNGKHSKAFVIERFSGGVGPYPLFYMSSLLSPWMSDIYNKGVDWEEKINIRPLK